MPRLLIALAVLVPVAAHAAGDFDKATEDRLANMVRQDCGSCHGLSLKGGLGAPIRAADLTALDVEALREIVLHGVPGTPMPGWAGIIDEHEADWIARKLKEGALE